MPAAEDRLVLVHVDGGHARPPGTKRGLERAGGDEPGAAGVDDERRGLHACEIGGRDDAAGGVDQPQVQRHHVRLGEERLLAGRHGEAVGARLGDRALATPREHVHAEGLAVAGHDRSDLAVAVDPECLAA